MGTGWGSVEEGGQGQEPLDSEGDEEEQGQESSVQTAKRKALGQAVS